MLGPLLLLLLFLTTSHTTHGFKISSGGLAWPFRGGGYEESAEETDNAKRSSFHPSLISLLSVISQTLTPACIVAIADGTSPQFGGLVFMDEHHESFFYPAKWNRSFGLPLLHTLALLSDGIILLHLEESNDLVGLVDGYIQRARCTYLPPGNLMVMIHDTDLMPLRSLDFEGLAPEHVRRFDMIQDSTEEMERTLKGWDTDGANWVDQETLLPLISRVYKTLGGQEEILFGERIPLKDMIGVSQAAMSMPRCGAEPPRTTSNDDVVRVALDELHTLQMNNALDETAMPIQFGKHATRILEHHGLSVALQLRLQSLHDDHTQTLRNYYGRLYETMLDKDTHKAIGTLQEKTLRSFRRAAAESIPSNAPKDWNCESALQGLIQDMKDMTDLRRDLAGEAILAEQEDDRSPTKRWWNHPPKWLKPLAARAIMIAVNYAQGWLALQGIRQAALERERHMPKIPLF